MDLIVLYGRFNPLTKAHMGLIDQMKLSRDYSLSGGKILIGISPNPLVNDHNPLTLEERMAILKDSAGPGVEITPDYSSVFDIVADLHTQFDRIVVFCGSDRQDDYLRLKKYSSAPVDVVCVHRDENNKISATLLREAARNNDYQSWEEMYGGSESSCSDTFHKIRERLNVQSN